VLNKTEQQILYPEKPSEMSFRIIEFCLAQKSRSIFQALPEERNGKGLS
jgi:hypothetical protein